MEGSVAVGAKRSEEEHLVKEEVGNEPEGEIVSVSSSMSESDKLDEMEKTQAMQH